MLRSFVKAKHDLFGTLGLVTGSISGLDVQLKSPMVQKQSCLVLG